MEIKNKVEELIRNSILYVDYGQNMEELVARLEDAIVKFLSLDDTYKANQSKENYKILVDSIAELHYGFRVGELLLSEAEEELSELQEKVDEIKTLLEAGDSSLVFQEDDRDLIVIGQLIKMSLYYSGDPTDINAEPQPVDGFSSKNRVFALKSKSSKLRKHLLSGKGWNLMQ